MSKFLQFDEEHGMSTIFPVDHHASFEGLSSANAEDKADQAEWSSRRSAGFILIAALASWILVLSPFLLLG